MWKSLRAEVTDEFASYLVGASSGYARMPPTDPDYGDVCFSKRMDGYNAFVLVLFSPRGLNQFTVEMAVSPVAEFPYDTMPDIPIPCPHRGISEGKPIEGKFRFRLGFLTPEQKEMWWSVETRYGAPTIVQRLIELVHEAGEPICRHVIQEELRKTG